MKAQKKQAYKLADLMARLNGLVANAGRYVRPSATWAKEAQTIADLLRLHRERNRLNRAKQKARRQQFSPS